ncbi:MAG: hypothetical protein AAF125_00205 [Chloroflexota bacterium]
MSIYINASELPVIIRERLQEAQQAQQQFRRGEIDHDAYVDAALALLMTMNQYVVDDVSNDSEPTGKPPQ